MTRLGYGDCQTWGGRHYDTLTIDETLIEQMENDICRLMNDNGFGYVWVELYDKHPEIVDELLRGQLARNREYHQ